MAFDPSPLLAIAALAQGLTGALLLRAGRRDPARHVPPEWGWGLGAGASGFAMSLAGSPAGAAPSGVLGPAAVLFGAGLVWAGTRRVAGRAPPRPAAIAAGALGWLGLALSAPLPLGCWRGAIGSGALAAYAIAAASDLLRGRGDLARRRVSLVLAAHGVFALLDALGLLAFGLAAGSGSPSPGWAAACAGETILFAVAFACFARATVSRPMAAPAAPPEPSLEDALTGVGNRNALFGSGAALLAEAAAAGRPFALLLMDLDGLRRVNDRHGRRAGDRLLVAFARLAHGYLPPTSLVCRLGDGLFAALLPGAAPERALVVADELRSLFAHIVIADVTGPVAATVSIGIAQARPGHAATGLLLEAAGRALASAKAAGRDYVTHEAEFVPQGSAA